MKKECAFFKYYSQEDILECRSVFPSTDKRLLRKIEKEKKETLKKEAKEEKARAKKRYYKKVWDITEAQPLYLLKGIGLRGPSFHLDHITPIAYGFKNNIDAKIIGHISNLQILRAEDNLRKNSRIFSERTYYTED